MDANRQGAGSPRPSESDEAHSALARRAIRNALLSVSGGAVIAIAGAGAAHAASAPHQALSAVPTGTPPSGNSTAAGDPSAAAATTGADSTIGTQSATDPSQNLTVQGTLGAVQIIRQNSTVTDFGSAAADRAANTSTRSAQVNTGAAAGTGSVDTGAITQNATGNATGQPGGVLIVHQDSDVTNRGDASSGGNTANGNASTNAASVEQDPSMSDTGSVANVGRADGTESNISDGFAQIATGAASAVGNQSSTSVSQSAVGTAGGALGGIVIVNQDSVALGDDAPGIAQTASATGGVGDPDANQDVSVADSGTAADTSGGNQTVANESINRVTISQSPEVIAVNVPGGGLAGSDVDVTLDATAVNGSDGQAMLPGGTTGDSGTLGTSSPGASTPGPTSPTNSSTTTSRDTSRTAPTPDDGPAAPSTLRASTPDANRPSAAAADTTTRAGMTPNGTTRATMAPDAAAPLAADAAAVVPLSADGSPAGAVGDPSNVFDGHPVEAGFSASSATPAVTGARLAHTGAPLDDEGVLGLLLVLAGIPLERLARRRTHQLKEA